MSQTALERSQANRVSTVPAFAKVAVFSIAGVVAVAHFVASFIGGHWFDEMYMLAIGSNHPAWGYADQPPLTPMIAALMDWIAPGSIVALRFPAVLATAGGVVVAALIARELGGDRRAQVLAAGAQATAIWVALAGHWLTPYTLEPLQWLLLGWLLVRWLRLRDDRLLLVLGAVVGVAAQTKFQVLLLCAVLLLTVLVFGPRGLLRRPSLWGGAGIAAVIALPTMLWQAFHGWPQLRMSAVVSAEAQALFGGRPIVALGLIILAGIAGTVLVIYGMWRLLRDREWRDYRFLAATFVVLFVVFVVTAGRPYYLQGWYGLLTAAGAVGLQRRREAGHRRMRWFAWPAYALSVLAAGGMLLSSAQTRSDIGEGIAQRSAETFHRLTPQQQARTAIYGQSYIVAAYIDGYSSRYGLPPAYSGNRGYGYFPAPPETKDTVLFVGRTPDPLRPYFSDFRKVAEGGRDASVWLGTGKREPWTSFWPEIRKLTVA